MIISDFALMAVMGKIIMILEESYQMYFNILIGHHRRVEKGHIFIITLHWRFPLFLPFSIDNYILNYIT